MILLKKAIRAMLKNKRAYISCIILMAIGVIAYTAMNTVYDELETGTTMYYEEQKLADVFISVKSIPSSGLEAISKLKGIKKVQGRLVVDAQVILGNNEKFPHLRLVGADINNKNRLNNYISYLGDIKQSNDILLGSDFFAGKNYKQNENIIININQKNYKCNIRGYAFSPEYVYLIENSGDIYTDPLMFNFAIVNKELLETALGMMDSYNDITIELEDGFEYDDVKNELSTFLQKYDVISMYGVKDLPSYIMLDQEISGGKGMSTTVPMAFVIMAAIVLYLMLRRIIEQDRTQIGQLRAFGYSKWTVLGNYMFYGFVTGFFGAIIGLIISYMIIPSYMELYLEYFKLPIEGSIKSYNAFIIGGSMSVIGGILGAYFGAKKVLKLKPSEAMRPKAPKAVHTNFMKKFPFLKHIFNARGFMAIRNMSRNKIRSFIVVLGIVFSFGMLVMVGLMNQMMSAMFENHFTKVLKYDAEISLEEYVSYNEAVNDIMQLDDSIKYAEGVLNYPFNIHVGHLKKPAMVTGLPLESILYKIYDDNRKYNLKVEESGIVLSSTIAKKLKVSKGDYVYLETKILDDEIKVQVTDVVTMNLGAGAFMDIRYLNKILGERNIINSILVKSNDVGLIKSKLLFADNVKKVMDKKAMYELYNNLMGSYTYVIDVMQLIAVIISFVIIYNTAIISMSERKREYATLRVLGLHIKEVSEIMSFEYWLLSFVGIVLGIPFAKFLNDSLVRMIEVDGMSWPEIIPINAYIVGIIGVIISVYFSNKVSSKKIKALELVEVLKERE